MKPADHPYNRRFMLAAVCGVAFSIAAALAARSLVRESLRDYAGLFMLFLYQVFLIVLLCVNLKRNLRDSFYSYGNILRIGGILFEATLSMFLFRYFLSGIGHPERLSNRAVLAFATAFPKHFSLYAVIFLGLFCLLISISNISLIIHEGFRLKNLNGIILSVLYIGGTFLLYWLSDLLYAKVLVPTGLAGNDWIEAGYRSLTLFLLLFVCYYECVAIGAGILGFAAARKKPAYDKDYIIILGCLISREGGLLPLLKERVNRAIRYAWEQEIATGKPLIYVPSGGQGHGEIMSEGSAMEMYLLSHGAEQNEVVAEKKSANTWENMVFSKAIIDGLKPDAKVAFATTNFHVLRSGILARKAGLDAEGIASGTKWYFWPNGFVREFFGIMEMNLRAHVQVGIILLVFSLAAGFLTAFRI